MCKFTCSQSQHFDSIFASNPASGLFRSGSMSSVHLTWTFYLSFITKHLKLLVRCCLSPIVFESKQRFSEELRSGIWLDQSRTFTWFRFSIFSRVFKVLVLLEEVSDLWRTPTSSSEHFFLQPSLSLISFSADGKHLITMLPPPCFRMLLSSWCYHHCA